MAKSILDQNIIKIGKSLDDDGTYLVSISLLSGNNNTKFKCSLSSLLDIIKCNL